MTLHPTLLHARAALWSLTRAMQQLAPAAHAWAHAQAASDDLGTLQAWRPGTGGGGGGHGDPIPLAVLDHTSGDRRNPYADRHGRTLDTARWVARRILGPFHHEHEDPLVQLRQYVPSLSSLAADSMRRWIEDEDTAVRRLLRERDDRQLLPGVRCPACDTAGALALRTSAPELERVIVCTQLCPCHGTACRCGMGVQAAGVPHVWTVGEARHITEPKPSTEGAAA